MSRVVVDRRHRLICFSPRLGRLRGRLASAEVLCRGFPCNRLLSGVVFACDLHILRKVTAKESVLRLTVKDHTVMRRDRIAATLPCSFSHRRPLTPSPPTLYPRGNPSGFRAVNAVVVGTLLHADGNCSGVCGARRILQRREHVRVPGRPHHRRHAYEAAGGVAKDRGCRGESSEKQPSRKFVEVNIERTKMFVGGQGPRCA